MSRFMIVLAFMALVSTGWVADVRADDSLRDPAAGEFYSNAEIMELSGSGRDEYCEKMESLLAELRSETETLNGRLDSLAVMADTLRTQTIELSAEIREVNAELRELRLRRKSIQSYTTKPGDTLREVSKLIYGDPTRWKDIYDANKAAIGAEDAELKPGLQLDIPRKK